MSKKEVIKKAFEELAKVFGLFKGVDYTFVLRAENQNNNAYEEPEVIVMFMGNLANKKPHQKKFDFYFKFSEIIFFRTVNLKIRSVDEVSISVSWEGPLPTNGHSLLKKSDLINRHTKQNGRSGKIITLQSKLNKD